MALGVMGAQIIPTSGHDRLPGRYPRPTWPFERRSPWRSAPLAAPQDHPVGYTDTPKLPESRWRVHDAERPRPGAVTPGEHGAAPSDAIVLFDGTDLSEWTSGGEAAEWRLVDGAMEVNGRGSIETRRRFGDVQLHLEWRTPEEPQSSSQGRGNSGVFLMRRYEVQILDSFENESYADGQAAALYGQRPPLVNASRGPGAWQSYDILFRAPRFSNGTLTSPAVATVIHNGVVVHHAAEFLGATRHRAVAAYEPHAAALPIGLQDHGNPIRFRNIWVRPLGSGPSDFEVPTHVATLPVDRDEPWWGERFAAARERVLRGDHRVLFLGDSITQGWETAGSEAWEADWAALGALNLGFSGDRTQHLLWRLRNGHLSNASARVAVVMIGTNNARDDSPQQIADGVTAVVGELREELPDLRVLLLGVFPRGAGPDDPLRLVNAAVNERIARLADGEHVHFLDLAPRFLEADGTLSKEVMPDLLHHSPRGYSIWSEAIRGPVRDLLGD